MTRHVTGIRTLEKNQIENILARAQKYADIGRGSRKFPKTLKDKIVIGLFAENSTRTRLSFEIAVKRLHGDFILMTADGSSLKKGESLSDTCLTLSALRPDAIITRHGENGFADFAAEIFDCPVINAGDGTNEHPTQALLDALTLKQAFGDLEGRRIVICGDTKHSRVAHSNAYLLNRLGAQVTFASPAGLMDDTPLNVTRTDDFDAALKTADAVMMLRMQKERFDKDVSIDLKSYTGRYCLTEQRIALMPDHAVILHPGPMNRDIEISGEAADHARSLILRQVENGIYVRMACLDVLING